MTRIRVQKLDDLVAAAKDIGQTPVAVAGAEDREVLLAVRDAAASGLALPLLVGDSSRITAVAAQNEIDLRAIGAELVDVPTQSGWGTEVARSAVRLVRDGRAAVLVKGKLDTADLLRAVLDREAGLRTGRLLSHVALFDVPGFDRLLYISDGGVVLNPTLHQKLDITRNVIDVAHHLGLATPKVAVLAAAELVTEDMPATVDAAALAKMADRGQITGALVDGPFGLDNAVSATAAETKGLRGPVAGRADILIVPSVEAGNLMAKVITFLSGGRMAGVVVGASAPIAITSRADPHEGKLYSIALSAILASESNS
ncbi:MAG TPA: bifunctional enoyl-CoA hydratase/phosphate acetyltransferase [Chloroflexota bacterium]